MNIDEFVKEVREEIQTSQISPRGCKIYLSTALTIDVSVRVNGVETCRS